MASENSNNDSDTETSNNDSDTDLSPGDGGLLGSARDIFRNIRVTIQAIDRITNRIGADQTVRLIRYIIKLVVFPALAVGLLGYGKGLLHLYILGCNVLALGLFSLVPFLVVALIINNLSDRGTEAR